MDHSIDPMLIDCCRAATATFKAPRQAQPTQKTRTPQKSAPASNSRQRVSTQSALLHGLEASAKEAGVPVVAALDPVPRSSRRVAGSRAEEQAPPPNAALALAKSNEAARDPTVVEKVRRSACYFADRLWYNLLQRFQKILQNQTTLDNPTCK